MKTAIGIIGMILFIAGASIHIPAGEPAEWVPYIITGIGVACMVLWYYLGGENID